MARLWSVCVLLLLDLLLLRLLLLGLLLLEQRRWERRAGGGHAWERDALRGVVGGVASARLCALG